MKIAMFAFILVVAGILLFRIFAVYRVTEEWTLPVFLGVLLAVGVWGAWGKVRDL